MPISGASTKTASKSSTRGDIIYHSSSVVNSGFHSDELHFTKPTHIKVCDFSDAAAGSGSHHTIDFNPLRTQFPSVYTNLIYDQEIGVSEKDFDYTISPALVTFIVIDSVMLTQQGNSSSYYGVAIEVYSYSTTLPPSPV
ncbi:hypothetical protein ACTXT7_009571 [Hymenolepis weldensis]